MAAAAAAAGLPAFASHAGLGHPGSLGPSANAAAVAAMAAGNPNAASLLALSSGSLAAAAAAAAAAGAPPSMLGPGSLAGVGPASMGQSLPVGSTNGTSSVGMPLPSGTPNSIGSVSSTHLNSGSQLASTSLKQDSASVDRKLSGKHPFFQFTVFSLTLPLSDTLIRFISPHR